MRSAVQQAVVQLKNLDKQNSVEVQRLSAQQRIKQLERAHEILHIVICLQ